MRRLFAWATVLVPLVLVSTGDGVPASTAQTSSAPVSAAAFAYNWAGTPATPQSVVPSGWDVQIHKRYIGDDMDPMLAQHGAACEAPPATHPINMLADGVFICRNHLMTSIIDAGYGEIALTPDHLVDFSSGSASVTVDVSTLQMNAADWVEVWISPFQENLALPFEGGVDLQGPPLHGLRFSFNHSGSGGTLSGDVYRFDNYVGTKLPRTAAPDLTSLVAQSAVTRTTYEIDLSQNHVRFGLPTVGAGGTWWTDTNIAPLAFKQGVVQLTHHNYNTAKHCPTCGTDTWHWSNFAISNALPFSITNGIERSIHATGATTVHFPAPAPANAYLRFSGIGPQGRTYTVSYNGGTSWVSPALQPQSGSKDEHFSTYMTPIPAGTTSVMFRGQNWWGGPWWVRDPAIWSASGISPVVNSPTNPATNPPTNPPTGAGNPGSGSGEGGGTRPGTGEPGATKPAAGEPGATKPGASEPGATKPGSGEAAGAPSGSAEKRASSLTELPKTLLAKLAAVVNPTQDPTINVVLLILLSGAIFAVFKVIRG